jgi:CubicO group peptidase (beta-lactamase class C family)
MKKLLFLLTFLLVLTPLSAQSKKEKSDPRFTGIDAKLQALLSVWHTPGFAVAVVEKNKIVYAKGFGFRDFEKKIPVTPNTLFAIGSCTKAFTSSLLGILKNENLVDLDKSPVTYIPDLKFYNKEMDNLITIRDLMCHRTGLPRHDYSWYLFPGDSRDSLMRRIQYMEPSAGIREKYQYNNFMFMLQGLIAEKVTRTSWEENISDRFFKPLGMSGSNFTIEALKRSEDGAFGYTLKKDSIIERTDYYRIRGMSPAGSINSSVNDMSKWLITWINGGKFEGKEIIPASYITEAISAQMVSSGSLPSKENPDLNFSDYGFGWGVSSYKGHYRVQHGGAIDGFSALASFFPTDSIGIVILVNQDGSTIPSVVRNIIIDRMLKLPYFDWNKYLLSERDKALKAQKEAEVKTVSDRIAGTLLSHKLNEYTGKFSNPGYGTIKVLAEKDSLFAVFPIKKLWLKHYHYDIFKPYEVTGKGIDTTVNSELRLNFRTNDAGEIDFISTKIEPSVKPVEFKRVQAEIAVDKGILEKYAGEYAIGEVVSKVYIKNDKTLYLFVPGQPEYELVPVGVNKFSIKILEGYKIEFTVAENGNINGLLFIQPNGTFKATKK